MKPRSSKGFAGILENLDSSGRKRLSAKVPQWAALSAFLEIPSSLSLEQCSSEETALVKASLIPEDARLADLTGGLGVDSFAFSRKCRELLYNERNTELAAAVRHNFELLGVKNVTFSTQEVKSGGLDFVREFAPDWIYLDPARRAADGRKVFLLQDCSPDVRTLLPELFEICPRILLKLSPMADICRISEELPSLKQILILGSKGECKELLCVLEKDWEHSPEIVAGGIKFSPEQSRAAHIRILERRPQCGDILFEPSAILSKAGCYGLVCEKYNLAQVGQDVHLFIGEEFPKEGKRFCVLNVFPMGNEGIRQASEAFPEAEVSARGLKIDSISLRKKLRCRPSAEYHIFGVGTPEGKLLLCCRRL